MKKDNWNDTELFHDFLLQMILFETPYTDCGSNTALWMQESLINYEKIWC